MIYSISEIQNRITPVAEKYHLKAVYLFGSYARGTATETSDIDLLIDTAGTDIKTLFDLGSVYCDFEDALQKSINLITISSLLQATQMPSEIDFRNTVHKERKVLYAVA